MSCFNALANCCPTEPPSEECCVELSDIATLFPNGATLVSGNTTFTFPAGGWYKEGCCLRNTTYQTNGGFTRQCTSDWSYQCSESIKCHTKSTKMKRGTASFDPYPPPPSTPIDYCGFASCPDIIDSISTSSSVTEKGERVVVSTFVPIWANITIGKYLRNCGYGVDVCTYHIGVSVTYGLYAGGLTQGYKTWNYDIDGINEEIFNVCTNGQISIADYIAQFKKALTAGADNFPACNYIDNEVPPGPPNTMVTVSRVKIATSLNCPLSFTDDDNNPEVCNYLGLDEFCMSATQDQGPVSVTFNRTLPPVYVAKDLVSYLGGMQCCVGETFNSFPDPRQMFQVSGPGKIRVGDTWGYNPPPEGQQHLDTEIENGFILNSPLICQNFGGGCYRNDYPPNTIFVGIQQCCDFPAIGMSGQYNPYSSEQSDYTFNYSNVTGNTPIVHTYDIPSWTLNC